MSVCCMYSKSYSCQILVKLEFLDRFTKNPSNTNFMIIRPVGAELLQTDRHNEANSRCSQFFEGT